jgi:hypothetical protein
MPASRKSKKGQEPELDTSSLGAGDSYLVTNLLPPDLHAGAFENVRKETEWHVMMHRGTVKDGATNKYTTLILNQVEKCLDWLQFKESYNQTAG